VNLTTIATNLATRFSTTYVATPSGESAIVSSTHLLPNAIAATPCVLVFPPSHDQEFEPGGQRVGTLTFPVRFYLAATADYRKNLTSLYLWWDNLRDCLTADYDIGAPTEVIDATITSMEMRPLEYEDKQYGGIQITVRVRLVGAYSAST
jgi:hypothetical protein